MASRCRRFPHKLVQQTGQNPFKLNHFMKAHQATPSASYTFTMRLNYPNSIGMFSRITNVIGKNSGDLGSVDIVSSDTKTMTRDVTVRAHDEEHLQKIVEAVGHVEKVNVIHVSDRVFLAHLGGKIAIQNK